MAKSAECKEDTKLISIDVGLSQIAVAQLSGIDGKLTLQHACTLPTDGKLVSSEGILDKDALLRTLRNTLINMRSEEATITFSCIPNVSNEYILPYDKNRNRMLEMVNSKVFQTLSSEEYVMDYFVQNIFVEDGVKKCTVMTYVVPNALVEDSEYCLKALGKRPIGFGVAQHSILKFAQAYFPEKVLIVVHCDAKAITAHLLNKPVNIITRTAQIGGDLDVLAALSNTMNTSAELLDVVSKLVQYQAIKYPENPPEGVYVMGDAVEYAVLDALQDSLEIRVTPVQALTFPFGGGEDCASLLYAIGAILKSGV